MDTSLVTASSNVAPQQQAASTVFRKALDVQAQTATQLIEAIPKAQTVNPPNLGQSIDIKV